MWRILAVLTLLGALVGSASWMLFHSSVTPFLIPGATDIQVVSIGVWEWQLAYRVPGSITTWFTAIGRNLETDRWSSPDRVEYGALSRTYSRASSFGFAELWEWTFLTIDPLRPQEAKIRMRRQIAIPWWP
jgi:hypothetical protein